jgi:hypothetical protein
MTTTTSSDFAKAWVVPGGLAYRAVRTEIQRSTAGGGWTTIAVADDPDWADHITGCLSFFATCPPSESR